jgi:hypothetical protein
VLETDVLGAGLIPPPPPNILSSSTEMQEMMQIAAKLISPVYLDEVQFLPLLQWSFGSWALSAIIMA